ncbi:ATP-binding protein [Actinophytocola sp.]|uniref:ATP-binding protein n=1 Tax=Actinophytocola sp. TaxID=1872138 RepID=UPI002EDB4139
MTSSSPASAGPRHVGPWICVGAVTAYVLGSPFFLRNTDDPLWLVLWILIGTIAIGVVIAGAVLSARAGREHVDELNQLDGENQDLATLSETRRAALESLVDQQLPAIARGAAPPPLPDLGEDDLSATLVSRGVAQLARLREDQRAGQDAVQAAVVSLGRKVQASAHRIQEEAARMVQRHPTDADVLHTSMRVDHAAAQQARNAQSLAALCGEWPGQQWHQPLPLADVVRAAAGRITAYQRVEVSGDPGVAVSARVVEPLIHVLAELLANATQSSPPTTQVLVSLRHVQRGAVIEIDDGGVGLDDSRLEQVREIASGRRPVGLSELGEIPQTGLPVVGAYVRRHGFRVDVTESVYGGLRAIVLVPAELTEPVAPAGMVAAGGHALARRSERHGEPVLPEQVRPEHAGPVVPEQLMPERFSEPTPERFAEPAGVDADEPTIPPTARPVIPPTMPPLVPPAAPEPPIAPAPQPAAQPTGQADQNGNHELPALPRRRSRRGETVPPSTVDWPEERTANGEPAQTAEQAGQWMGAFFSTEHGENTREEQR